MTSSITADFRKHFQRLPPDVQVQARTAYRLWVADANHNSLFFKPVSQTSPLYSARVGQHWRVLGLRTDNHINWFWIGPHSHYDRLIKQI